MHVSQHRGGEGFPWISRKHSAAGSISSDPISGCNCQCTADWIEADLRSLKVAYVPTAIVLRRHDVDDIDDMHAVVKVQNSDLARWDVLLDRVRSIAHITDRFAHADVIGSRQVGSIRIKVVRLDMPLAFDEYVVSGDSKAVG